MNTQLQTVQFDGLPLAIIDHNGEGWFTGDDIGKALDYSTPRESINKIFERNRDELEVYSVEVKLTSTDGKQYDTRVYNEEGAMMIAFFSKQPKAAQFRKWAVQVLKAYRHQELTHQSTAYLTLQNKYIGLLEEKVARMEAVPVELRYPRKAATADEIAAILRCVAEGYSYRDIAKLLGRGKASVTKIGLKAKNGGYASLLGASHD